MPVRGVMTHPTPARDDPPGLSRVAIGGITTDNGNSPVEAGTDRPAAVSAGFDTPDMRTAAQSFSPRFAFRTDTP